VLVLEARPESLEISPGEFALIVVDMQNAYCSRGGYFDLAGFDVEKAGEVVKAVGRTVDLCRKFRLPVVWLQNGWDRDLKEAGGPASVNQLKGNALKLMRARKELQGKLLTRGGWDYDFVEGLKPNTDEFVVSKTRYSGFAGTHLDSLLRSRNIRYLAVCGVATNVCVESTLRDAFFAEYFGILIRDACQQAGPDMLQDATIFNIERFFGWSASIANLENALARHSNN